MIKNKKNWFSLIELIVGMFIFAMGITSVFSVIISTININDTNKNYIIASSLAREQIELFRNIRDSNYNKIQIYNQINPATNNHSNVFRDWTNYIIENDFSSSAIFPVKVTEINDFVDSTGEYHSEMESYRVCLSEDNIYTYDCSSNNELTPFYKYISVEEVKYKSWVTEKTIENALRVTSKVIWFKNKWYKEFYVTSIFTDYKRF